MCLTQTTLRRTNLPRKVSERRKQASGSLSRDLSFRSRQEEFGPRSFEEKFLRFADSILGDEKDNIPDRIGRSFVVPAFLLIMVILPFVSMNNGEYPIPHPKGGANEFLFPVSLSLLLLWTGIVVSKVALQSAGFRAADAASCAGTSQRDRQQP